jgi:hypothetical protein
MYSKLIIITFSFAIIFPASSVFAACDDHGKMMNVELDCLSPLELSEGKRVPGNCKDPKSFLIVGDTGKKYCFSSGETLSVYYKRDTKAVMEKAHAEFSKGH